MTRIKRLLCLFLTVVMVLSIVPTQVFASEVEEEIVALAEETATQGENKALTLSPMEGKYSLLVGESCALYAEEEPAAALSWISSDEAVATVDASGQVTAVAPGCVVITAVASDGTEGTIEITVEAPPADSETPAATEATEEVAGSESEETVPPVEDPEATGQTDAEETSRETEELVSSEQTEVPMMYYRYEDYGFDYSEEPFPQDELTDAATWAAASQRIPTLKKVVFEGRESANGPGTVWLELSNPNPDFNGEIFLTLCNANTGTVLFSCRGVGYYFGNNKIELPWLRLDFGSGDYPSGKYYVEVYFSSSSACGNMVRSNVIDFWKPLSRIPTPANSRWTTSPYNESIVVAGWDKINNAVGYNVNWSSQYGNISGSYHFNGSDDTYMELPLENSGQTRFRVQALANLNDALHSEFGPWSNYAYGEDGTVIQKQDPITENSFNYSFRFEMGDKPKDRKSTDSYKVNYSDSFFASSSRIYNHSLAQTSIKLAMSAFGSVEKRDKEENGKIRKVGDVNVRDFMNNIGISPAHYYGTYYNSWDYWSNANGKADSADSAATAIGSKPITCNAEPYTLLVVAIRGAGYGAEWGGNFRVGPKSDGNYHQGFNLAADKVLQHVDSFVRENGISGNIKLWITGYSRAGGTANIVAGKLVNGSHRIPGVSLQRDNIFAYTFEAPAGVKTSKAPRNARYDNIFNIINATDFVPKLAPTQWRYQRYGKDLVLPELNSSVEKLYKTITGSKITKPYEATLVNPRQGASLDLMFDRICTRLAQYYKNQSEGEENFRLCMQENLIQSCIRHNGLPGSDAVLDIYTAALGITSAIDIGFIAYHGEEIISSHYPERCLAFIQSMSQSDYCNGKYKNMYTNCPVDINVYSGDTLVASIKNDEVVFNDSKDVDICVNENGQKEVYTFADGYRVEVIANDTGVMDITVADFDPCNGGKVLQTSYLDVPLDAEGQVFEASVSTSAAGTELTTDGQIVAPDAVVSQEDMHNTTISVVTVGNGSVSGGSSGYTPGDTAVLVAEPAVDSVFLGWYLDGEVVSRDMKYDFRVRGDAQYTAVFASKDCTIKLDRENLILKAGSEPQQILSEVLPEEWAEFLTWRVKNEDDPQKEIIALRDDGPSGCMVTPLAEGTAYAVADITYQDYQFTAMCRIDVTKDAPAEELIGDVTLSTNNLTVELYKNDYAVLRIFEDLPQNAMAAGIAPRPEVTNNGVAVTSAGFDDAATASYFDLVVKDDGSIHVVPKDSALLNAGSVKSSYTSPVTVTVGTRVFHPGTVKLTIKKTLPKLSAKALNFNSFYTGQALPVTITGGKIMDLAVDTSATMPTWLELTENQELKLTDEAVGKHSGKVNLQATVSGYGITIPVSVTVKASCVQPKLALEQTSVTLYNSAERNQGYPMRLVSKDKNKPLDDMHIAKIHAPDGYRVEQFDSNTGDFLLIPETNPVDGTIYLNVAFKNTSVVMPLSLKIKTADVTIKASTSTVTLNPAVTSVASIKLTPDRPDYRMEEPLITVTDEKYSREIAQDTDLSWSYENNILTIKTAEYTAYGVSYKVTVCPFVGGQKTVITVNTPSWKKSDISMTARAIGAVDTSIPGSKAVISMTYKNYVPYGNEGIAYRITAVPELEDGRNAAELFDVSIAANNMLHISQAEGANISAKHKYTITVNAMLDEKISVNAKTISLPIKCSELKVELAKKSVVLNAELWDEVSVGVASATKGYTLTQAPVIRVLDSAGNVTDKLRVEYAEGILKIRSCEKTTVETYKVMVAAEEGQRETALTVNAVAASKVQPAIIVSGNMDVLRPDATAVKLTYSLPNFSAEEKGNYSLEVVDAEGNDCTNNFAITEQENRSFLIRPGEGANSAKKYRVRLVAHLPLSEESGTGAARVVFSPYVTLKLTMGKAVIKADKTKLVLHADDRHSAAIVHLSCSDYTLAGIKEVKIRNTVGSDAFYLENLGGDNYAVRFAQGVGVPVKPIKLTLDITMKGNITGKPNTSLTVTVSTTR